MPDRISVANRRMTNFTLLILTLVLSHFSLPYAALASDAEKITAVTENLPPYQVVENNTLVGGSSYLLVKELLARAGYQASFQVLPWARAYQLALTQENTLIFSMTRSAEREDKFKWIGDLRELSYSFFSLSSDEPVMLSSVDDVKRYTVVAVRNSFEAQSLLRQGFVVGENLVLTGSYHQAWQMVYRARVDFMYANALIGDNVFQSLGLTSNPFIRQPFIVEKHQLYIAASLTTKNEFVEDLRRTLIEIKNDGTFYQINSAQPALGF